MCCQMRDLIDYMEKLSSRACIEKMDISQVINKRYYWRGMLRYARKGWEIS